MGGLVEATETLLSLTSPLVFDFPYIPVLPAHLAVDVLANPVPFLYGLTTALAASALRQLSPSDAADLVVVDVAAGRVDAGVAAFLERQRAARHAARRAARGLPPLPRGAAAAHRRRRRQSASPPPRRSAAGARASVAAKAHAVSARLPYDDEDDDDEEDDEAEAGAASGEAQRRGGSNRKDTQGEEGDGSEAPLPILPFPEPYHSEAVAALRELRATATDNFNFNFGIQSLFLRLFACVFAGYRNAVFFPGLPPAYGPVFAGEQWATERAAALGATAALARLHSAAAGGSGSTGGQHRGRGAGASFRGPAMGSGSGARPDEAKAFLLAITSTQMFNGLLARHASAPLSLRPFHALCAKLPPSPSLRDSATAAPPPPPPPRYVLVVPPPGFITSSALLPWQRPAADGLQLLPAPGVTSPNGSGVQPPLTKAERRGAKLKGADAAARRWTVGAVAAALRLPIPAVAELEMLVAAGARGNFGPTGDDVGAAVDLPDDSANETAALLAAAAEAAGASANPVTGSEALRARVASPPPATSTSTSTGRVGRFAFLTRKSKRAAAQAASAAGADSAAAAPPSAGDAVDRMYSWTCTLLNSRGAPATSTSGDAAVAASLTARAVRAAFARVLQAQSLYAAGLSPILSGALGAGHAASLVQLQPLLGLGVTPWTLTYPALMAPPPPAASSAGAAGAAAQSGPASTAAQVADGVAAFLASTSTMVNAAPDVTGIAALPFRGAGDEVVAHQLLLQTLRPTAFRRLAAVCGAALRACADDGDSAAAGELKCTWCVAGLPLVTAASTNVFAGLGLCCWRLCSAYVPARSCTTTPPPPRPSRPCSGPPASVLLLLHEHCRRRKRRRRRRRVRDPAAG